MQCHHFLNQLYNQQYNVISACILGGRFGARPGEGLVVETSINLSKSQGLLPSVVHRFLRLIYWRIALGRWLYTYIVIQERSALARIWHRLLCLISFKIWYVCIQTSVVSFLSYIYLSSFGSVSFILIAHPHSGIPLTDHDGLPQQKKELQNRK